MQNRREFLKTAAFAALGSGMAINGVLASERVAPALFNINKSGVVPRMKLRFFPYELKLRHVFTVAAYSRTTTPDVQVEIEYDGIIGYGEASMPPYLQHELGTMDSVLAFLKKGAGCYRTVYRSFPAGRYSGLYRHALGRGCGGKNSGGYRFA